MRKAHSALWRVLCCAAIGALLTGCAQQGDFGRYKSSAADDLLLKPLGAGASYLRSEPHSNFPFTDDEKEYRALSQHFLMPSDDIGVFQKALVAGRLNRIYPLYYGDETRAQTFDRLNKDYSSRQKLPLQHLLDEDFASHKGRYNRLSEMISADRSLLPGLCNIAARVRADDKVRYRAIQSGSGYEDTYINNALDRISENEALAFWIEDATLSRVKGYRYALERLVVITPDRAGLDVEHNLYAFEQELQQGNLCSLDQNWPKSRLVKIRKG